MVSGPKRWWDIGSDSQLTAVKWSSDGSELLLATFSGKLIRFDPRKGQLTHSSQIKVNGHEVNRYIYDVAYVPSISGFALRIDSGSSWPDFALILDPISGSELGNYLSEMPDYLDASISPDGRYQLVKADVERSSGVWCQIRKRGLGLTDEWQVELEGVACCIAPFEESPWSRHPYAKCAYVNCKSWDVSSQLENEEAYFNATGQLITDDLFFIFTEKDWWHADLGDKAIVIAPKGELFTAELGQVNWTTSTVQPESLCLVDRPKNWAYAVDKGLVWGARRGLGRYSLYGYGSTLQWSPDGKYIAATKGEGFIGLWSASDGRFVRPIGCHRVIRKESMTATRDRDFYAAGGGLPSYRECIHWSPDGNYIASVFDRRIFVWEVESGHLIDEFYNSDARSYATMKTIDNQFVFHPDGAICWGPDSKSLASVSLFGDVEIYSL
jgi:WD40 repeat protein